MIINKKLTPFNFNDASRGSNEIKYIVIHYVGALGGAESNCNYYASKYIGASAHYFVGFSGEIWQSVLDEDVAWHCGAKSYVHPEARNSNSIGIELCVRKVNTGNLGSTDKDWYFEDATVTSGIQLTQYLMKKYNISADHIIRHYDVTGKICPNPYVYNTQKHKWDEFLRGINGTASNPTESYTKVMGVPTATAAQLNAYIHSVSPTAPQLGQIYIDQGNKEDVRGDIAFAQSCLETGNWTFAGSAVTLDQNNFCGMGVTQNGMKGNSFKTSEEGVLAQIQHLKAYGSKEPLKTECVDPRFKYVERGCAEYVEWLGIQENPQKKGWASGKDYGAKILNILNLILKQPDGVTPTPAPTTMYRVRKTWSDAGSQKGAYKILANAKNCADANPGYYVFDASGTAVYPEKSGEVSQKSGFIKSKVNNLNVHSTPEWGDSNVCDTINNDGKYYTVVGEVSVNGGSMYKLKSGVYVTTSEEYVTFTSEPPKSEPVTLGYVTGEYILSSTMKVRTDHSISSRQKTKAELTPDGRLHSNSAGCLLSGTHVTALEIWQTGTEAWMRGPSGWICIQNIDGIYARKV